MVFVTSMIKSQLLQTTAVRKGNNTNIKTEKQAGAELCQAQASLS